MARKLRFAAVALSSSIPAARLAMLLPEFPAQTHAFFWREIVALRSAGIDVAIFSTRRPSQQCPHDWAPEARRQTTYLYPPAWLSSLGWGVLHPARLARGLKYVFGLRECTGSERLKTAGLIAPAIGLLRQCQRAGIGHVHCHSFANAAHVCALARAMGGPSYSLTLHGDLPVYGKDHASKLRHCLAVTTAGSHLVEPVAALGFARERILPNPMGVDTERFAPAPRKQRTTGESGPLRVITVARLNSNKGHRFVLGAMRRLIEEGVDVAYTIVGEGPYRAELEREIREQGLEDRVSFKGGQAEEQVIQLLREHDVFVLPSVGLGEAAPVSVMEAMSCGLPVVASIIGSTPAMIRDNETGFLVPQGDSAALERALASLAADADLRWRIGDAARAAARMQFSAEVSSRRLLEHLRQSGARI